LPAIYSIVDCPHLEGLELADVVNNSSRSLRFLWVQISSNRRSQKGDVGPTAVSSKLGWLLSGPADRAASEITSFSYSAIIIAIAWVAVNLE